MTDQKRPPNKSLDMQPDQLPDIGLALGSGLARGFAHIGVLKALNRHGIYPKLIAGTSIGALVGGCYLAGRLEELEDWARSLNRRRILSYLDFRVRSAGLIGGRRLERLLHENFQDSLIEDLPLRFISIATDMVTGHEVWLRRGRLKDCMRASFSLPGIFPPVLVDNRYLVDGALVNPVPVSACQAMGARMVIAVDLNGDMIGKATKPGHLYQTVTGFDLYNDTDVDAEDRKGFQGLSMTRRLFRREINAPSLFGVMVSSLNIVQDRLTRSRLAGDPPDIHLKPTIGHIGLLEFEKCDEMITAGEKIVEDNIREIQNAIELLIHLKL